MTATCHVGECREEPSLVFAADSRICTAHARKMLLAAQRCLRPLLRPVWRQCVILRDVESDRTPGGLYKPPSYMGSHGQTLRDSTRAGRSGERQNAEPMAMGLLLAAGRDADVDVRESVGQRVWIKVAHESELGINESVFAWRGLTVVYDGAVYMADVEETGAPAGLTPRQLACHHTVWMDSMPGICTRCGVRSDQLHASR